jgi:DEAD/DEAH box helicase domain-containing protein
VLASPCSRLVYSDEYLSSPLTVRLFIEMARAFSNRETDLEVVTLAALPGKPRGKGFATDWADLAVRNLVLGTALAEFAPKARVRAEPQLAHRRVLWFETPVGSGSISFDQGMGSWRMDATALDHGATVIDQFNELMQLFDVRNNPAGTFMAAKLE